MHQLLKAGNVWDNFADLLAQPTIVLALVLAVLGIAIACLATRVASVVRKQDPQPSDPIIVTMKVLALILIAISLALIIITFFL